MAEGLPVFESGQRPLARDFQALVAAVRGLLAGGVPVAELVERALGEWCESVEENA